MHKVHKRRNQPACLSVLKNECTAIYAIAVVGYMVNAAWIRFAQFDFGPVERVSLCAGSPAMADRQGFFSGRRFASCWISVGS